MPTHTPEGRRRGTRQRVLDLLRRESLTAGDLANRLGLTHNAVRAHLVALEHGGLVVESGARPTASRPAALYTIATGAEASFSRAYVPFAASLVRILSARLAGPQRAAIMREVGTRLAAALPPLRGDLRARAEGAAEVLEELGGAVHLSADGDDYLIEGHGCPLGEVTREGPDACQAVEALLGNLVEAPVRECCDREDRPRCRFRIQGPGARA